MLVKFIVLNTSQLMLAWINFKPYKQCEREPVIVIVFDTMLNSR